MCDVRLSVHRSSEWAITTPPPQENSESARFPTRVGLTHWSETECVNQKLLSHNKLLHTTNYNYLFYVSSSSNSSSSAVAVVDTRGSSSVVLCKDAYAAGVANVVT